MPKPADPRSFFLQLLRKHAALASASVRIENLAIVPHTVAEVTKFVNFTGPVDQQWGWRVERESVDFSTRMVQIVPTVSLLQLRDMVRALAAAACCRCCRCSRSSMGSHCSCACVRVPLARSWVGLWV